MIAWPALLCVVIAIAAWRAWRRQAAGRDAEAAQRDLLALLAEQADQRERADDRAIADNLDL